MFDHKCPSNQLCESFWWSGCPIHFEQPVLSDAKRYYIANWRTNGHQSQKHQPPRICWLPFVCLSDRQYYGQRRFVRGFTMVNRFWTEKKCSQTILGLLNEWPPQIGGGLRPLSLWMWREAHGEGCLLPSKKSKSVCSFWGSKCPFLLLPLQIQENIKTQKTCYGAYSNLPWTP